jgi:hypothetical protein
MSKSGNYRPEWPVPEDWSLVDGGWTGYCLAWPASFDWSVVLRSLLYSITRGRLWDGHTGSVRNTQAIAWEIFDRNTPLAVCGGQVTEPIYIERTIYCGGSSGEESEMGGQVVTDVKVVDGKIRVFFGPCCFHDLEGVVSGQVVPEVGSDPWEPPLPGYDSPAYSACAKARGFVEAVYSVIEAAFTTLGAGGPFWLYLSALENNCGFNLNDRYAAGLLTMVEAFGLVYGPSEVWTFPNREESICRLKNLFADDSEGIPDGETWDLLTGSLATGNLIQDGIIVYAWRALGRENLDTVVKLAATNLDAECACLSIEPVATDPDANGWYLSAPVEATRVVADPYTRQMQAWQGESDHEVYGFYLRLRTSNENYVKRCAVTLVDGGFDAWFIDVDISITANTSDHWEALNQLYPVIQLDNQAIAESLCASMGYAYFTRSTGAVDGTVIATPDAPIGNKLGWRLDADDDVTLFEIEELRLIHNVNSPSHSA